MAEAVIVAATRSPIGRARKGSLVDVRPDDLAAMTIKAALDQVPALDPATLDDLHLGCAEPHDEHEDGKEQDGDAEDEDDYIGSERRDYDERDAYEQLDDAHDPVFVEELEETEDGGDDADGHHRDGGDAGFQPDEEHAHDDEEQAQHDAVVSHLCGGLDLFCHYITSIYAAAMRRFFV